jgi:hypothetical protein
MSTLNPTKPAAWPDGLVYLHPVVNAYTSSIQSAADAHGNVYYAIVLNPPGGIATQYCQIVKVTPANAVIALRTIYARDSRDWLLSHGCDPTVVNGKYGNVSIAVRGNDLVMGFEQRINNTNTTTLVVLPGYAQP